MHLSFTMKLVVLFGLLYILSMTLLAVRHEVTWHNQPSLTVVGGVVGGEYSTFQKPGISNAGVTEHASDKTIPNLNEEPYVGIIGYDTPAQPSPAPNPALGQEPQDQESLHEVFGDLVDDDKPNGDTNEPDIEELRRRLAAVVLRDEEILDDSIGLVEGRRLSDMWTNTFFEDHPLHTRADVDFTLVSHTSFNRLSHVKEIAKRWPGPIIISVFLESEEERHMVERLAKLWPLVFPHVTLLLRVGKVGENAAYPVNELRNEAFAALSTSHFLFTDIDLWPDSLLYHRLKGLPLDQLQRRDLAIVVPAFERRSERCCQDPLPVEISLPPTMAEYQAVFPMMTTDAIRHLAEQHGHNLPDNEGGVPECSCSPPVPSTFEELQDCWDVENCFSFQGRDNQSGHSTSDYPTWWEHGRLLQQQEQQQQEQQERQQQQEEQQQEEQQQQQQRRLLQEEEQQQQQQEEEEQQQQQQAGVGVEQYQDLGEEGGGGGCFRRRVRLRTG